MKLLILITLVWRQEGITIKSVSNSTVYQATSLVQLELSWWAGKTPSYDVYSLVWCGLLEQIVVVCVWVPLSCQLTADEKQGQCSTSYTHTLHIDTHLSTNTPCCTEILNDTAGSRASGLICLSVQKALTDWCLGHVALFSSALSCSVLFSSALSCSVLFSSALSWRRMLGSPGAVG